MSDTSWIKMNYNWTNYLNVNTSATANAGNYTITTLC